MRQLIKVTEQDIIDLFTWPKHFSDQIVITRKLVIVIFT